MADLIDRQAAIKAICEDGTWLESQGCVEVTMAERKQRDADIICSLPSADAEPVRHGHWINHPDDLFPADSMIECSVCHEYECATANDNFCGNCGARMDGD